MGTVLMLVAVVAAPAQPEIAVTPVAPVWAGHPVGFALLTDAPRQYVAFYDAQRRMTVAQRDLRGGGWTYVVLPERVVWDSHNYITLCLDDDGYLHLSGNMHCDPLVYFRTAEPYDAATFERVPAMTGREEQRVTYPKFLRGPDDQLLFTYRDGSSGNGNQIYNVYDYAAQSWRRLLDQPLTDGQGAMNAYFHGPTMGPDGYYHMCWVWRDHGGCESNHDLSYARSKDLVHWERSDGAPYALPIRLSSAEIVDPVPVKGGIINGNTRIGFDSGGRVIITYHKYDPAGHTQIYNARREEDGWRIYQTTDWDYRWDFSGGGAIGFEVHVGSAAIKDGRLTLSYGCPKTGSALWALDEATLKPVEKLKKPPGSPRALAPVRSDFPGMRVNWRGDLGASGEPGLRYMLRWETLGPHRDRPREGPWPAASMLELVAWRPGQ